MHSKAFRRPPQLEIQCVGESLARKKGRLTLSVVVLIIGIVTNVVPQILDYVPFLPQHEIKKMPVETLTNPSQ